MRFLRHGAGYTLWDKKRSDEIMSQLGTNKLDKQIHEGETKLAGPSTEDAIRKSSQVTLILSTDRKT
jgi:hypothetical protein